MRTAEMLFQIANTSIALGAAFIALLALRSWRAQQEYKRKAQIAGEALGLAYEAVDAFRVVRSPMGWASDGASRKRVEGETEELTRALNDAFIPIERILENTELFGKMRRMRYRLMVEFGPEYRDTFEPAFAVRSKIVSRARLVMQIRRRHVEGLAMTEAQQRTLDEFDTLRWEEEENDAVNQQLQPMVQHLETLWGSIRH